VYVLEMRLVSFSLGSQQPHVGVLAEDYVVDLTAAYVADGRSLARGMRQLLEEGEEALEFAASAAASGLWRLALSAVKLLAPIYDPEKILCVGMNYRDHCTEQNFPIPEVPVLFSKFASAIIASGEPIPYDAAETKELDFEVELVVVIGRGGKHIPVADAAAHIVGYTVAHDVSARDLQMKTNNGQWLLGKTGDGFAPIGPAIVTSDELSDAEQLGIRCFVNGKLMQQSNTRELVHGPAQVVAYASRFMTLKPGDLIFTGTPGGVGCFRKPPIWLKDGDEVICEIDCIGRITNRVHAMPAAIGPACKRAKL